MLYYDSDFIFIYQWVNKMPDISMCTWEWCPLKNNCYRFKAPANELYQTYIDKPPFITHNNTIKTKQSVKISCDYFIKDTRWKHE